MMGIVGSQIKIERIFSMSKVITSLKMLLAWDQELEQINYYHENLPKYLRFDYWSGVQIKSLEEFLNVEYVVFE